MRRRLPPLSETVNKQTRQRMTSPGFWGPVSQIMQVLCVPKRLADHMERAIYPGAGHPIGKDEGRGKAKGSAIADNARLHFNPLPQTCACDEIDRKIDGHQLTLTLAEGATQTHCVVCQGRQKCTMDQAPAVAMRRGRNNAHVNRAINPFRPNRLPGCSKRTRSKVSFESRLGRLLSCSVWQLIQVM